MTPATRLERIQPDLFAMLRTCHGMTALPTKPSSLLERLHPDLFSVVCTFLPPLHVLRSLSRVNHSLSSSLSPTCFRGGLIIDTRLVRALVCVPSLVFSLLSAAVCVSVEYGGDAGWKEEQSLFSAKSARSLLSFASLSSLYISHRGSWDFVNGSAPVELFFSLLQSAKEGCAPLFPRLAYLHLRAVAHYPIELGDFSLLVRLPALKSLQLSNVEFSSVRELEPLLRLPALQHLHLRACSWAAPPLQDEEVQRAAIERGARHGHVELLWSAT